MFHSLVCLVLLHLPLDTRLAKSRHKHGGCGLIHICPTCKTKGCYQHLNLNDETFDFGCLSYVFECVCGYGLASRQQIELRGTFQGAIPCYLCSTNSNPELGLNTIKFMRNFYK